MKNYIIISLLFLLLGCSQNEYNIDDIIRMDNGLYTEKFSDEPITGRVYTNFGENSNLKKVYMGKLLNGKKDGLFTTWYENGKKELEATYKDDVGDGLFTTWYENGQKKSETIYKDGKKGGLETKWYDNGQKESQGTWLKYGKQDGFFTWWYENGNKKFEQNLKDGVRDGLYTFWYKNEQKASEGTWKDGKIISRKEWNEDGSVKE